MLRQKWLAYIAAKKSISLPLVAKPKPYDFGRGRHHSPPETPADVMRDLLAANLRTVRAAKKKLNV